MNALIQRNVRVRFNMYRLEVIIALYNTTRPCELVIVFTCLDDFS
jgi:hypothetical protein